jgi:hypothetical protein
MDDQMPLPAINGTLTALYPRKTGESSKGPWSFQNGELTQGKAKIKLVFKGLDEPVDKSLKGKDITITAHKGDKGWTGIYSQDNEYQGKTTREIKVTPTATIEQGEGGGDNDEGEEEPQQRSQAKPAGTKTGGYVSGDKPVINGVHGATVGMAVKEASTYAIAIGMSPGDVAWATFIKDTASDLIRISLSLEAGHLSPKISERGKEAAPPKAKKGKPAPEPEPEEPDAAEGDEVPEGEGEDSEVPF